MGQNANLGSDLIKIAWKVDSKELGSESKLSDVNLRLT